MREQSRLAQATLGPNGLLAALQAEALVGSSSVVGVDPGEGLPVANNEEARDATDEALEEFRGHIEAAGGATQEAYEPVIAQLDGLKAVHDKIDAYSGPAVLEGRRRRGGDRAGPAHRGPRPRQRGLPGLLRADHAVLRRQHQDRGRRRRDRAAQRHRPRQPCSPPDRPGRRAAVGHGPRRVHRRGDRTADRAARDRHPARHLRPAGRADPPAGDRPLRPAGRDAVRRREARAVPLAHHRRGREPRGRPDGAACRPPLVRQRRVHAVPRRRRRGAGRRGRRSATTRPPPASSASCSSPPWCWASRSSPPG